MTSSTIQTETQFEFVELTLNGVNALEIFVNIEIFENIFLGGVVGSISIIDSDSLGFIEENEIEFIEEISFAFKDARGDELRFEGYMNGLRDEISKNQSKLYVIDFTSKQVRQNEMVSITRAFRDEKPADIVRDMVQKLGESEQESPSVDYGSSLVGEGEPLNWVSGNRKPLEVIKYVVNHGVVMQNSSAEGGKEEQGTSKGTSGYLFWETLDGYRFCAMDDLVDEVPYDDQGQYSTRIANRSESTMEDQLRGIIVYDFPKVGDYFEKLRSGAFKSNLVSFNMDTGILTNFRYDADEKTITDKQKSYVTNATRTLFRAFTNEKFTPTCDRAQDDHGDQSRRYLAPNYHKTEYIQ